MALSTRDSPRSALMRLPLPLYFGIVFLIWTGAHVLFQRDASRDLLSIAITVLGGLVFATVLTVIVAYRRRRLGGADQSADYVVALRTGSVPPTANVDRWRSMLGHDQRMTQRTRLLSPLVFLIFAALGLVLAFAGPSTALEGWIFTGIFVAFGIAMFVSLHVQAARIARLEQALGSSERSSAARA